MFQEPAREKPLIQSEAQLNPRAIPDTVVGREERISEIAEGIRPIIHGETPNNVLVQGPPGVGKSTCVHHILDRLEGETNVKTVSINCWQYNTRPSLLAQLLIDLGYPTPRKGKPADELLTKLREWLDKNRSVVIALEEFDQIKDATKVVYDLQHIGEKAENDLGLILTSNESEIQTRLDPRSQSRLNCLTVSFDPYSKQELKAILEDRIEKAFPSGTVDGYVPDIIADVVAGENGDCRKALNMLLRATRRAEQENADSIEACHVQPENPPAI